MLSKRTALNLPSLRIVFAVGILCAFGLIAYGKRLIPATSDLSVAATVSF
jgi:hypothetical protein